MSCYINQEGAPRKDPENGDDGLLSTILGISGRKKKK